MLLHSLQDWQELSESANGQLVGERHTSMDDFYGS